MTLVAHDTVAMVRIMSYRLMVDETQGEGAWGRNV